MGAEQILLGKLFQKKWCIVSYGTKKPLDILLKKGNIRGLKEEERKECEFNLWTSKDFK